MKLFTNIDEHGVRLHSIDNIPYFHMTVSLLVTLSKCSAYQKNWPCSTLGILCLEMTGYKYTKTFRDEVWLRMFDIALLNEVVDRGVRLFKLRGPLFLQE
jgi:hypothetical protein